LRRAAEDVLDRHKKRAEAMTASPVRPKKSVRAEAGAEPAPAAVGKKDAAPLKLAPLSERLPTMSETQLLAQQASASRISRDPQHPKHAAALRAAPMIDAEIKRRASGAANA
jgi:hypothetical protein